MPILNPKERSMLGPRATAGGVTSSACATPQALGPPTIPTLWSRRASRPSLRSSVASVPQYSVPCLWPGQCTRLYACLCKCPHACLHTCPHLIRVYWTSPYGHARSSATRSVHEVMRPPPEPAGAYQPATVQAHPSRSITFLLLWFVPKTKMQESPLSTM